MREIERAEAQRNLSVIVARAAEGETAILFKERRPAAVIIGFEERERLSKLPSFGELLMPAPSGIEDLPPRDSSALSGLDL